MWASKAKQGHANTMPIYSNAMDRTGVCGLRRQPPVVSIKLECAGTGRKAANSTLCDSGCYGAADGGAPG